MRWFGTSRFHQGLTCKFAPMHCKQSKIDSWWLWCDCVSIRQLSQKYWLGNRQGIRRASEHLQYAIKSHRNFRILIWHQYSKQFQRNDIECYHIESEPTRYRWWIRLHTNRNGYMLRYLAKLIEPKEDQYKSAMRKIESIFRIEFEDEMVLQALILCFEVWSSRSWYW